MFTYLFTLDRSRFEQEEKKKIGEHGFGFSDQAARNSLPSNKHKVTENGIFK